MDAVRWVLVVLAGGIANAIVLYVVNSADFYPRESTNPVTSPVALALFALVGAAVGFGVGRAGWIAAPLAFYLGYAVLAFTPTLSGGTPLILNGYRLATLAITFAPFAPVAVLAAVTVGLLRRGRSVVDAIRRVTTAPEFGCQRH